MVGAGFFHCLVYSSVFQSKFSVGSAQEHCQCLINGNGNVEDIDSNVMNVTTNISVLAIILYVVCYLSLRLLLQISNNWTVKGDGMDDGMKVSSWPWTGVIMIRCGKCGKVGHKVKVRWQSRSKVDSSLVARTQQRAGICLGSPVSMAVAARNEALGRGILRPP